MNTYQIKCSGEKEALMLMCRKLLVSKSARVKNINLEQGVIDARFRYGINPFGLRVTLTFIAKEQDSWEINICGDFVDAADTFGAADKKAKDVRSAIHEQIQNPSLSHENKILSKQDMSLLLHQVKTTSIFQWVAIVLIALAISGIPTGIGFFFVPLIGLIGSLIGLPLSRWLVKRAHRVQVIDRDNSHDEDYFWLYDMVENLANKAGTPIPEVGIYESNDMNAFASGATPNYAVVAFSTALLERMNETEIEAVAAHELGHIIGNDMRAMAILTGLISSFILIFTIPLQGLRVLNWLGDSYSGLIDFILWIAKFILSLIFTFLGSLAVKAYSRRREYKADAIAALLVGKEAMISALNTLSTETEQIPVGQRAYNSFKLSNRSSWAEIFSTHPSLEKRIEALKSELHSPL